MPLHPLVEPFDRAEVGGRGHILAHNHAERMRLLSLHIIGIGADIADMGESEGDDLPGKARISHDLLVTGHRGMEADFADRLALRAESAAPGDLPIGQYQYARRSFGR